MLKNIIHKAMQSIGVIYNLTLKINYFLFSVWKEKIPNQIRILKCRLWLIVNVEKIGNCCLLFLWT